MTRQAGAEAPRVFRSYALLGGLILFCIILAWPLPPGAFLSPKGKRMAAVAVLMAVWWMTEAIPIPATALLPLALFPLLGIMPMAKAVTLEDGTVVGPVVVPYANHYIFLFLGGFFIAIAMQRWGLEKRIALRIIHLVGTNRRRLVLGFMLATAFLSMWISNTATAMMMMPIGLAIAARMAERSADKAPAPAEDRAEDRAGDDFGTALMLGIAYAASLGGIATLVGTPPNLTLARVGSSLLEPYVASGAIQPPPEITFAVWFKAAFPLVVILLPLFWFYLTRIAVSLTERKGGGAYGVIEDELRALGRMRFGEKVVLVVFSVTALLWIFRRDLDLGIVRVPGWSSLGIFSGVRSYIHDSTVAMAMALLLFVIPTDLGKGEFVLDWEWARKVPWGILFLFGGGFALADGFRVTGLSEWIGGFLSAVHAPHPLLLVGLVCLVMTFLTELTSNTATTEVMLPILAPAAVALGVHPFLLMVPATITASCAFMLPVATPPNAIVFASGYIPIKRMARTGLVLNLICVVIVSAYTYLYGLTALGV